MTYGRRETYSFDAVDSPSLHSMQPIDCPICGVPVYEYELASHVDTCLARLEKAEQAASSAPSQAPLPPAPSRFPAPSPRPEPSDEELARVLSEQYERELRDQRRRQEVADEAFARMLAGQSSVAPPAAPVLFTCGFCRLSFPFGHSEGIFFDVRLSHRIYSPLRSFSPPGLWALLVSRLYCKEC